MNSRLTAVGHWRPLLTLKTAFRAPKDVLKNKQGETPPDGRTNPSCNEKQGIFKTRIVGGKDAELGDGTWYVRLGLIPTQELCGATLIREDKAVTASHCLYHFPPHGPATFSVTGCVATVASIHAMPFMRDESDRCTQMSQCKKMIPHPTYDPTNSHDDIALLYFTVPFVFNAFVKRALLPGPDFNPAHKTFTLVGFGSTQWLVRTGSPTLQKLRLPYFDKEKCVDKYNTLLENGEVDYGVDEDKLCAGYKHEKKDGCQGDSGGGLVYQDATTEENVLVGVVSWGYQCAALGVPGIYTEVAKYIDFVRQN